MKYLVETTGNFLLIDLSADNVEVASDRPSVVVPTAFIQGAASRGQLRVLNTNLPAEANDAEFAEYWAADRKIAIDAYLSKFEGDAIEDPISEPRAETPAPAPKPRKARSKKA